MRGSPDTSMWCEALTKNVSRLCYISLHISHVLVHVCGVALCMYCIYFTVHVYMLNIVEYTVNVLDHCMHVCICGSPK